MFPITVTLHNAEQLNAVLAAMGAGNVKAGTTVVKEVAKEKKSDAATGSVGSTTTAADTAAQEKKAEVSEVKLLTAEELPVMVKDAIAKSGRDPLLALLKEFGAGKASEVVAEKRAAFDAALRKLAGK